MTRWKDVVYPTIKESLPIMRENFKLQRELEDKMIARGIPLPPKSLMLQAVEDLLIGRRK